MTSTAACEARLAAVAADQHGVFTRAQATAAGFRAPQIERRVVAGVWQRSFPRVYRNAAAPASSAAMYWAAALWAGPECALSHSSAAALWGMGSAPVAAPELIVSRARAPRCAGAIVHRVARYDAVDVVRMRGLPVTAPVRTIIDLAGILGDDDLAAVLERACTRGLVTVRAVGAGLDDLGATGRPGVARLRTLLTAFGSGPLLQSARMAG